MAAGKVSFELVAPERVLARSEVDMVVIPGAEGDFGVLPEHAPFLSLLRPGTISIWEADKVTGRVTYSQQILKEFNWDVDGYQYRGTGVDAERKGSGYSLV